jgi:hypothetical protein
LAILTALSIEFERCKQWLRSRLTDIGELFLDLSFDITPLGIRFVVCSRPVGPSCAIQFGNILSPVSISGSTVRG